VLVPWMAPKLTPEIVTDVPTVAPVRDKPLIVGIWDTVNGTPLLATPSTVATIFPVVAPIGTGTTMLVEFQLVGVPGVPLNVTILDACVSRKFAPEIVTDEPGTAMLGDTVAIEGAMTCAPKVTEILSKVAVARLDVLPLVTTRPTSTFVDMTIVTLDPICTQFAPSEER
jgi:hypothetical protein